MISLQSKGLSRVFSNTTAQRHQFFGAQPFSRVINFIARSRGRKERFTLKKEKSNHVYFKRWSNLKLEYYSDMKSEALTLATVWMGLENTMLSEMPDTKNCVL